MAIYTLYSYQCCPLPLNPPSKKYPDMFEEKFHEAEEQIAENMRNHQKIIDNMLTIDCQRHFLVQKKNKDNTYDNCLAFTYKNKAYYFKVLLPGKESTSSSRYLIRIANPKKSTRELDFKRTVQPDEPSTLVIIDNTSDQQRILIEHTRAWDDTDSVKNILQEAIGNILRKQYHLSFVIEPVWRKDTFRRVIEQFGSCIKSIEFEVGYPNMGRTGNKFLEPLKESLRNTYAAGTVKYSLPKEATRKRSGKNLTPDNEPRKTLMLDSNELDPVMEEIAEHCQSIGSTTKFGLTTGHNVKLMRVPEAQLKKMSPELRKIYEQLGDVFSNYTVSVSDTVSNFDGQDDLFHGVENQITEVLQKLKEENA